jgi:hypothetical protein
VTPDRKPVKQKNRMKRNLLFLVFMALSIIIRGQQNYQDVLFLKNGSIIRGIIVNQLLNESVRIVASEGDSLNFNVEDIKKITREVIPVKNQDHGSETWLIPKYQLVIEGGLAFKIDRFGSDYYKLRVINGIRLAKSFSFGIGAGLHVNSSRHLPGITPDHPKVTLLAFYDLRIYCPFGKNLSGYFAADIGYSFSKNQSSSVTYTSYNDLNGNINYMQVNIPYSYLNGNGLFLNPSVGIGLKLSERTRLNIGTGYEMQKGSFTEGYYTGRFLVLNDVNKLVGSIGIYAGIEF